MWKWIKNNKSKIDLIISFIIVLVSILLLVAEKKDWSQSAPNYCLIVLATLNVFLKLWISKSNSKVKMHTAIECFLLLFIIFCSAYSIGNMTTFVTATLAFISCDFLLETGSESENKKMSRKEDALTRISESLESVHKPDTIKQDLIHYKNDILTLRNIYKRITLDHCFEKNDREKFEKENQNFYKKLGYIDKKANELDKDLYDKFYYNIMNFINDQSDR